MTKEIKIPQTFNAALHEVSKIIREENATHILDESESNFGVWLHNSLGRWIRNNWGLWEKKGPLYEHFVSIGVEHPDDMTTILFTTLHRRYHNINEDIEGQVCFFRDYWERWEE